MPPRAEAAALHWLGLLLGEPSALVPEQTLPPVEDLLSCAQTHGVAALVAWRLQSLVGVNAELGTLKARLAPLVHEAALASMLFARESQLLFEHLHQLRMPGLLLKGVALGHWAYPQPHLRQSSDIDLLVPSLADALRLAGHLRANGYAWEQTADPEVAYELLCTKTVAPGLRVEIDIHWHVAVTPLLRHAFTFEALMEEAQPLPALGPHAHGLGPVDAFLHACINRAFDRTNGIDEQLRLLVDLPQMAARYQPTDWQALTQRAQHKHIAGFVLSGMEACEQHLNTRWPETALLELRAAALAEPVDRHRLTDWRYMQWKIWQSLPDWPSRFKWLQRRLMPNRSHLEHAHGGSDSQGHTLAALLWRRAASGLRKLLR